jgi:hypothetical protein
MPTHLYCLLPRGSSASPPADARVVETPTALAWVSDVAEVRLSRDARDAARATIAHDRVIGSALQQRVTPIPASLADPYEDDAALRTDVAAHAPGIALAFPAIAGMIEMTTIIAVQDTPPAADAPGRGKAYLEQIRSAPARAAAVADRMSASLRPRFPNDRRREDGSRVALSHLMPWSAIDLYRRVVLEFAGPGYRVVIDGPRAPYSFALFSPGKGVQTGMWLGGTILAD